MAAGKSANNMRKKAGFGLAAEIRAWISKQPGPFTAPDVCDALGVSGRDRERVKSAVRDCVLRGEVTREGLGVLTWNPAWRSTPRRGAPLRAKVLKAFYTTNQGFTANDIRKLSEVDINYIQKVLKAHCKLGHIRAEGKHGRWTLYRIADRERFRVEVLR